MRGPWPHVHLPLGPEPTGPEGWEHGPGPVSLEVGSCVQVALLLAGWLFIPLRPLPPGPAYQHQPYRQHLCLDAWPGAPGEVGRKPGPDQVSAEGAPEPDLGRLWALAPHSWGLTLPCPLQVCPDPGEGVCRDSGEWSHDQGPGGLHPWPQQVGGLG